MEDTVRLFNDLTRPEMTPGGLPNHFVFGIRHMPVDPPRDVVVAINPHSGLLLLGGSGQTLSVSSISEKAQAVLPFLLDAFISGDEPSGGRKATDPPPFAPWTWATEDHELAKALETSLSQHGVVDELCRVGTCSDVEKEMLALSWSTISKTLSDLVTELPHPQLAIAPGDTTSCHGCGMSRESFSEPLKKCSACGKAWYHSKDCQRDHWKEHKPACLANRSANINTPSSTGASSSAVDGHKYYNTTARSSPEAQALLSTLHLSFPSGPRAIEAITNPLRSLIYAGKDTPENMQLLFGPDWRRSIGKNHDEMRIDILLEPPRGSPSYAVYRDMNPDDRLCRSPRPATDHEKQLIGKVREMQDVVCRRIGVGKSPSKNDMVAILSSYSPGQDWPSHLQTYLLAINTMDQGVEL